MGQAAVDLPDPLQTPSAPNLNNADDLLSQLAGDEIDRLLATSDEELPTEPEPQAASAALAEEANAPTTVESKLEATSPAPVAAGTTDAAAASTVGPVSAEPAKGEPIPAADSVQKDLDQLLAGDAKAPATTEAAANPPAAPEPTAALESTAVATPAAVATLETPSGESASPSAATSAPSAEAPASTPGASPEAPADESAQATVASVLDAALADNDRTPPGLLVRFLEFLNSPFAAMGDDARESFGKIAIVTTVNAIAILIYVILFRKH
jgi:hypothetical protein